MSPEAVRARTDTYGSPGVGSALDSSEMRISPDTECRSSQAGRWSAIPMLSPPDAVRRSTEPEVEDTAMSPEAELAWTPPCCTDWTGTSPGPDFAGMGQCTSPGLTPPEPELTRPPVPSIRTTDTSPEPVEQSRSTARANAMLPEPLMILERPMS